MRGCTVHAERAARRQQLHVAPCSRVKPNGAVTTKVDIQNAPLCQLSYAESLIQICIQLEFSGSDRGKEQRYVFATVKHIGLISRSDAEQVFT